MARFERVSVNSADWSERLSAFPDAIVFQSPAWVSFLAETQNGEPVVAALREGKDTLGYFTGLVVRKFGLRILGSPFRGWSTPYMGFNLPSSVSRRVAVEALSDFAFRELGCIYLEVTDSRLPVEELDGLGFSHVPHDTMEIDLTQSEDDLLAGMTKSCRWTVRKAERNGLVIEEAQDLGFADDYAAQLKDVFAKQGLVPHYGAERVRSLIKHLLPTGGLLLLRARDPEGRCIATGAYPAMGRAAFYWGGASWRDHQKLYPNELLHWYAVRYWKKRGMTTYNMVGTMDFKRKFGGRQTTTAMIFKSKYPALSRLRSAAMPLGRAALHLAWKLKTLGRGQPKESEA